jgi:nicotinate-nucleotide pyrophosphorylase (carboxylating)
MLHKQITKIPSELIIKKIKEFILEDIPNTDVTTNNIFINDLEIKSAKLLAKSDLVLSGEILLDYFFDENQITRFYKDGDFIQKGEYIAEIKTTSSDILKKERVMLNLIQRMSGIASTTKIYVDKVKDSGIKILDTRKTTPGLRYFEKYAVQCGGGTNHRFDLSSAVMIKDNHIACAGSISKAIEMVLDAKVNVPIEIEVDNLEQLDEVLKYPVDSILLDNFNRVMTITAVKTIREKQIKQIVIESSGGINLDNISDYIGTGIDAISSGALTHSVKSADISLDII